MADQTELQVSRRKLLVTGGVGAVAAVLGLARVAAPASAEAPPLSEGVIYPDAQLCVGCLGCEVACSTWHVSQGLSAVPRIRILNKSGAVAPLVSQSAGGKTTYVPSPCKQCPDPECYAVCPADALRIDAKTGARYIEESVCTACGKCATACPFPSEGPLASLAGELKGTRIFFDPDRNVYVKCDLCRGRDGGPACVATCPVNHAILVGTVKSDHLCLEVRRSDKATYQQIP